jgi:hypothetical protein
MRVFKITGINPAYICAVPSFTFPVVLIQVNITMNSPEPEISGPHRPNNDGTIVPLYDKHKVNNIL